MKWVRNLDRAWEYHLFGKVVAGIVKKGWPAGIRFIVFKYDYNKHPYQHIKIGICEKLVEAQKLAEKVIGEQA